MNIINFLAAFNWNWCSQPGVQEAFNIIKAILNILRIAVPFGLVALTTFDVIKKVIDPEEKEGQQKIMRRAIAALIVFLVPTMIRLVFILIDWGTGVDVEEGSTYAQTEGSLSMCWEGYKEEN